jgi:F0F1-type ATP synthase assembly protein I
MYELPKFDSKNAQKTFTHIVHNKFIQGGVLLIIILTALGICAGTISVTHIEDNFKGILSKSSPISPQTRND